MGKSLFEFASQKNDVGTEQNKSKEDKLHTEKKVFNEKQVKDAFDKYSKFSSSELLSELYQQVNQQKKDGSFNFAEIAERIEGIKPMLTDEQIKNLDKLLSQIK